MQENEVVWGVLFAVIVLSVLSASMLVYRKRRPVKKNQGSTRKAGDVASQFARSNDFRIIRPAVLEGKGRTAHLDALVVGYFGVLGVKALGHTGEVYGNANENTWVQIAPNRERISFANPITEASADVRVVRDALFAAKIKAVPVEVAVVFTEKNIQLALPRSLEFYTTKTFHQQLKKEKYQKDAGIDLDAVEKALRAALKES